MKIEMPKVALSRAPTLEQGKLYIVQQNGKSSHVYETAYLSASDEKTVIYVSDGGMETGPLQWFYEEYTIVRPYAPGERLVIEA